MVAIATVSVQQLHCVVALYGCRIVAKFNAQFMFNTLLKYSINHFIFNNYRNYSISSQKHSITYIKYSIHLKYSVN
jgi:hypothetical protein